jgi:integrase
MSAVSAFYQHQVRHGVDLGELLVTWQPGFRRAGGWKPFLHHISKGASQKRAAVALREPKKVPRVMSVAEVQTLLDGCERLRDRLLLALLHETGMRIGEALGLRHSDIAAAERQVTIRPRHNANGARSKSRDARTIPVSAELIRLLADYLHGEYGELDSDYVFVNLWKGRVGQAWTYRSAYEVVIRFRKRTGLDFDPHWLRHTAATRWLRDRMPLEAVAHLLGHSSVVTTQTIYGHLTVEDCRRALEQGGWFSGHEVVL